MPIQFSEILIIFGILLCLAVIVIVIVRLTFTSKDRSVKKNE
jgi:hypothetical protein